jgi:integrase
VDIRNGALEVTQNKTGKRLRIVLDDEAELSRLLTRIRARGVSGMTIISTARGERVTAAMHRNRFEAAREAAARTAEDGGNSELATRIRQFQFRDIRPRAASDTTLAYASALLGHTGTAITERVYRRKGSDVKPLK